MADNPFDQWPATEAPPGWETPKPKVTPEGPPPQMSAPGYGMTDRLNYLTSRGVRAIESIMQPSPQKDPKTGEQYWIDPISKERMDHPPMAITPLQSSPDRATAAIGSGIEGMVRHPILSMITPGTTFATSGSNELLRGYDPLLREGVGAGIGFLGLGGASKLATGLGHLLSHGGIPQAIWHYLSHAPAALPSSSASLLARLGRAYVGESIGSEKPLTYNELSPQINPQLAAGQ